MKLPVFLVCLLSLSTMCCASEVEKSATVDKIKFSSVSVDKSKFSNVYPAVWFSPSTGEIAPLAEGSEMPPEEKYEIWIEPRDPEFGFNPGTKSEGGGFALLGQGDSLFEDPGITEGAKLTQDITHLMHESQGSDGLVFYCRARACECLVMITAMNSKEEVITFKWRLLKKNK